MLLIDPTEAASSTRNPLEFINQAAICTGFEAQTGADILISTLDTPRVTDVTTKIGQLLLRKHCATGTGILVQRKSAGDVLNFIRDHNNILGKMLQWTEQPWLLLIGQFGCDKDSKLIVDGQRVGGSEGWSYWSYWGALRAWQARGGYVDIISRDTLLLDWYKRVLTDLQNPQTEIMVAPRKPSQQLLMPGSDPAAYERNAAISALATVDGIGLEKAIRIVDYCGGKLKNVLVFLSDPAHIAIKKDDATFPAGLGPVIFANFARWLGLASGGMGDEQWREVMVVGTVLATEAFARKTKKTIPVLDDTNIPF